MKEPAMKRRIVLAAAVLAVGLAPGAARSADAPAVVAGAKVVTAEDVLKLLGAGALVVDARIASADGGCAR